MLLVKRFMLRIAPEIARSCLRQLAAQQRSPYIIHDDAEETQRIGEVAQHYAQVSLQLAMRMAGTYAQFETETQDTAPTSHPAQEREPEDAPQASTVQSAEEILPSPFPTVPSVQKRTKLADPSYEGPHGNPFK